MKHSEALRKAQQDGVGQTKGVYIKREDDGKVCACAAGAIAYAKGYPEEKWGTIFTTDLLDFYPELYDVVSHPSRPGSFNLISALVDLNDTQNWTFDQIVEWLEANNL